MTSDLRLNYELLPDGPCDRRYGECFGYASYGLLPPYVNAIILETASYLVGPDFVCSLFYAYCPFVVYTCLHFTFPRSTKHPYELSRILTSPYELPAIWSIAPPRATTLYYNLVRLRRGNEVDHVALVDYRKGSIIDSSEKYPARITDISLLLCAGRKPGGLVLQKYENSSLLALRKRIDSVSGPTTTHWPTLSYLPFSFFLIFFSI